MKHFSIFMLTLLLNHEPTFANKMGSVVKSPGYLKKVGKAWYLEIRNPTLGKGSLELQGVETQSIRKDGLYVEVIGRSCVGIETCVKVDSITPLVLAPISKSQISKLNSLIASPKRQR